MSFNVPLIIRGKIIEDADLEFGGRGNAVAFTTPDVKKHLADLPLARPSELADLHALPFEEVLDYLEELGSKLNLKTNEYLQEAIQLSYLTSGLSQSVVEHFFSTVGQSYNREFIREHAENCIGVKYLEGWVPRKMSNGGICNIRAFGVRSVHVLAGNVPVPSSMGVIRNAITRSDAIFKTPSNDPLTAAALARTMVDMAPDHPVTRHLSVAYWKGGDDKVESEIYDPRKVEKIIAWGGLDSISHITKYLQPGIDLITQDPKLSGTLIGKEAFEDEATLQSVAKRLALDIGAQNQEGCVSARVIYVESGTDDAGIDKANKLGGLTFAAMQKLPPHLSTPHKDFSMELKEEIDGARVMDEDYRIFGGQTNEGAVIVSQEDYPVDFSRLLACRVGNIVPVDSFETAVRSVNAYTQTIGIYPESLKKLLRDRLAFQGGQRLVSLGGASTMQHNMEKQDAIEPVRRMLKWVSEETADGALFEALADDKVAEASL